MKKKVVLLCVAVLLLLSLSAGTLAYFTASAVVHNVFTMGTLYFDLTEMELNEGSLVAYLNDKKDIQPDTKVSKVPIIENTGSEPFYTRVYIEIMATDVNGEKLTDVADVVKLWSENDDWAQDEQWFLDQADWIVVPAECGEEGVVALWYYYDGTVEPGQKVAPFNVVEFTKYMGSEYVGATITVSLRAQAVQVIYNEIPEGGSITDVEGWPELDAQ